MASNKQSELQKTLDEEYNKTLPGEGAQTSDYYSVGNVPKRFNRPGSVESSNEAYNEGNPVFSCAKSLKYSGAKQDNTGDSFKGYESRPQHPMYMTSSSDYGSRKPTVHTMPSCFHARDQKFTGALGPCGMYRNHSLNTAVDKSKISNHFDGYF